MFTDGAIHDLNYFDVPLSFKLADVTAASYEEEKDALYFLNSFEIPDGAHSIKFTYYNDREQIIGADTVPVLKDGQQGEQGEQGTHGPSYQGLYEAGNYDAVTNSFSGFYPADAVEDDYFLNSSDGYIWVLKDARWNPSTDYAADYSRYMQAVNDATGAGLSGSTEIVKAMNIWVKNIAANVAFIEELFANKINAKDINIENGSFNGSIDAGPLLLNFNPAYDQSFTAPINTTAIYLDNIIQQLGSNDRINTDTNSYYGTITIAAIKKINYATEEVYKVHKYTVYDGRAEGYEWYSDYTQTIYRKKEGYGIYITTESGDTLIAQNGNITYRESITGRQYRYTGGTRPVTGNKEPLPAKTVDNINTEYELYIHIEGDMWTFRLRMMPTVEDLRFLPEGAVYIDENNFLKIVR